MSNHNVTLNATGVLMQYSFIQSVLYFLCTRGGRESDLSTLGFIPGLNNKYIYMFISTLFNTSALLSKYGNSKKSEHRWKGLPLVFSRLLANRLCAGLR